MRGSELIITTSFHFITDFSFSKGGDKKYPLMLIAILKLRFISVNEEKRGDSVGGKKEKEVERMLILSDELLFVVLFCTFDLLYPVVK